MGYMALKMLEKGSREFSEEDLAESGLKLLEVTVFSGLCSEPPPPDTASKRRRFCFQHYTFQVKLLPLHFLIRSFILVLEIRRSKEQHLW